MKKKITPKKKEQSFASSEVMSLLEQMNDGIAIIAESQQETNVKIDVIDKRLINVENRLMSVEEDVIEIKHRISEKVDRDEFNKMEKRMIKLEKLVFAKLA
jgi:hypothetical protein